MGNALTIIKQQTVRGVVVAIVDCKGGRYDVIYCQPDNLDTLIKKMYNDWYSWKKSTRDYLRKGLDRRYTMHARVDMPLLRAEKRF